MWKSTSLASVSQLRMKRTEGPVSGVPPARARRSRISAARAGSACVQAAAARPRSSLRIRSTPRNLPAGYFCAAPKAIASNAVARMAGLEQRESQQVMAGRVIGPLLDRFAIAVDRQRQRMRSLDLLEALAREPAHVGATGEEVDDRSVGAGGVGRVAERLVALAERHQRQHVARIALSPGEGARQRFVRVAALNEVANLLERAGDGRRLRDSSSGDAQGAAGSHDAAGVRGAHRPRHRRGRADARSVGAGAGIAGEPSERSRAPTTERPWPAGAARARRPPARPGTVRRPHRSGRRRWRGTRPRSSSL